MKSKKKLIALVSSLSLVVVAAIIAVAAVLAGTQSKITSTVTIKYEARNVYADVTLTHAYGSSMESSYTYVEEGVNAYTITIEGTEESVEVYTIENDKLYFEEEEVNSEYYTISGSTVTYIGQEYTIENNQITVVTQIQTEEVYYVYETDSKLYTDSNHTTEKPIPGAKYSVDTANNSVTVVTYSGLLTNTIASENVHSFTSRTTIDDTQNNFMTGTDTIGNVDLLSNKDLFILEYKIENKSDELGINIAFSLSNIEDKNLDIFYAISDESKLSMGMVSHIADLTLTKYTTNNASISSYSVGVEDTQYLYVLIAIENLEKSVGTTAAGQFTGIEISMPLILTAVTPVQP